MKAGPTRRKLAGTSWQVWGRRGEGSCGGRWGVPVPGCAEVSVACDTWSSERNGRLASGSQSPPPTINSGRQTQGHGRQMVPPTPDICPQCSLAGLFTTGHPESDQESGMTGPPTGPPFTPRPHRRWTPQAEHAFQFAFPFVNFVIHPPQQGPAPQPRLTLRPDRSTGLLSNVPGLRPRDAKWRQLHMCPEVAQRVWGRASGGGQNHPGRQALAEGR